MLSHIVGFFGTIFTWFFRLAFGPACIWFGAARLYDMIRYGECLDFSPGYEGKPKPGFGDYAFQVVMFLGAIVMGAVLMATPFK